MFKYRLPSFVKYLIPQCIWKVNTKDKVLYLTFDDGPHPQVTNYVLELLDKYNGKATFFCVADNVKKYPETYKKIIEKGHIAGNHTFHHLNYFKTDRNKYLQDIQQASELINSNLFRPPYGKILPGIAKELSKNYKIIMWSLLTCDFDRNLNRQTALKKILNAKKGDIIVFHDSNKAFDNLQFLLPKLLHHFHQLGYSFNILPF